MKEEKELILYPNKIGTVKTLLEEAAKQIELNPEEGSGQLRILEVCSHKVMPGPREDDSLECKWFLWPHLHSPYSRHKLIYKPIIS